MTGPDPKLTELYGNEDIYRAKLAGLPAVLGLLWSLHDLGEKTGRSFREEDQALQAAAMNRRLALLEARKMAPLIESVRHSRVPRMLSADVEMEDMPGPYAEMIAPPGPRQLRGSEIPLGMDEGMVRMASAMQKTAALMARRDVALIKEALSGGTALLGLGASAAKKVLPGVSKTLLGVGGNAAPGIGRAAKNTVRVPGISARTTQGSRGYTQIAPIPSSHKTQLGIAPPPITTPAPSGGLRGAATLRGVGGSNNFDPFTGRALHPGAIQAAGEAQAAARARRAGATPNVAKPTPPPAPPPSSVAKPPAQAPVPTPPAQKPVPSPTAAPPAPTPAERYNKAQAWHANELPGLQQQASNLDKQLARVKPGSPEHYELAAQRNALQKQIDAGLKEHAEAFEGHHGISLSQAEDIQRAAREANPTLRARMIKAMTLPTLAALGVAAPIAYGGYQLAKGGLDVLSGEGRESDVYGTPNGMPPTAVNQYGYPIY